MFDENKDTLDPKIENKVASGLIVEIDRQSNRQKRHKKYIG